MAKEKKKAEDVYWLEEMRKHDEKEDEIKKKARYIWVWVLLRRGYSVIL